MGYREDIVIDKYNLDREWMNQPVLFLNWAEKEVEAQFERDKAKERLDLIKAELDLQIRTSPSSYGIDKITESSIQNTILRQKVYTEASESLLLANKNAKILNAAREAFEHRKKALEKITDLYISGYWADPKIKQEAKDLVDSNDRENHLDFLRKNPRLQRRVGKEEV
jgi:hypothetical protein